MDGRGALDYRIKPLAPMSKPMIGVAVTCHCGPADNLACSRRSASARPGDILVAATDAFTATSITGDLLMGMARNRGVARPGDRRPGARSRRHTGRRPAGLSAPGSRPIRRCATGPARSGCRWWSAVCNVDSGDVMVGDDDGVVVIRRGQLDSVIAKLADVRAAEAALEAKVKAGLEIPDFITAILASDRIARID